MTNRLYYGDNLRILREQIAPGSVDLVYLDPPFNSNATYNVLFRAPSGEFSQAQIEAFEDTGTARFRKIQILTSEELLNGARPNLPIIDSTAFRRARREEGGRQGEMEL